MEGTQTAKFFDPSDSQHLVFGTVDLHAANGWTTKGISELGADSYGGIPNTSPANADGNFWFDTMNSPGSVDISHSFTDTTAAIRKSRTDRFARVAQATSADARRVWMAPPP